MSLASSVFHRRDGGEGSSHIGAAGRPAAAGQRGSRPGIAVIRGIDVLLRRERGCPRSRDRSPSARRDGSPSRRARDEADRGLEVEDAEVGKRGGVPGARASFVNAEAQAVALGLPACPLLRPSSAPNRRRADRARSDARGRHRRRANSIRGAGIAASMAARASRSRSPRELVEGRIEIAEELVDTRVAANRPCPHRRAAPPRMAPERDLWAVPSARRRHRRGWSPQLRA